VSCPTRAACTAVGYQGNGRGVWLLTEHWSGSSWRLQSMPATTGHLGELNGVSCSSPRFCAAVGETFGGAVLGTNAVADTFNGRRWRATRLALPGLVTNLTSVSCVSASFCVAVGDDGLVGVWRGRQWTLTRRGRVGYHAVSCVSAAFCAVVASHGVYAFTGHSWKPMLKVPSMTLRGATCTSSVACVTVGSAAAHPVAEVLRGRTWTRQTLPAPASPRFSNLFGVSCTSSTRCVAVGGSTTALNLADSALFIESSS
jgi:hypothetical protein